MEDQRSPSPWVAKLIRSPAGGYLLVLVVLAVSLSGFGVAVAMSRANPLRATYLSNMWSAAREIEDPAQFAALAIHDPDLTTFYFLGWTAGCIAGGLIVYFVLLTQKTGVRGNVKPQNNRQ